MLAVLLLFTISVFRVYYGGGVGFHIVRKDSPGFSDTIVNLDEIFGMPRIVVAAQHPGVKRQMEQMGWTKDDEQVVDEATRKLQRDLREAIREAKEAVR